MASALSNILSSSAKFLVLEVLIYSRKPLALRHIAVLSACPLRSVQLALQDLHKMRAVRYRRSGNRQLYSLSKSFPLSSLLERIFKEQEYYRIEQQRLGYSNRGKTVLEFNTAAREMLSRARTSQKLSV